MKKTPKSIHISAIVLNSILLLVSIFLFIRLVLMYIILAH